MTLEQLPPEDFTEKLKTRRQELHQLLNKKLRALKNAPEGHLSVAQAHGGRKLQYYHVTTPGDTRGIYIPHKQLQLARVLYGARGTSPFKVGGHNCGYS